MLSTSLYLSDKDTYKYSDINNSDTISNMIRTSNDT